MALQTIVGSFTGSGSTGNQAVTGLGFQPKAIIFFNNKATTDGDSAISTDGPFNFGMAVSTSSRYAQAEDGGTVGDSNNNIATATIIEANNAQTITGQADFVSFDAGGFTVSWATGKTSTHVFQYLAFGGSDLTNVGIKTLSTPAATGNVAYTGVGFKPDAIILVGSGIGTPPTSAGQAQLGLGFGVSSTQRGYISFGDGATAARKEMTTKVFGVVADQATTLEEADLVSLDSDGFTLNWTTRVTGDFVAVLCLKGGQYFVGSDTQKTTTGTKATTGVGFQPTAILLGSANAVASSSIGANLRLSMGAGSATTARGSQWLDNTSTTYNSNMDRAHILQMKTGGVSVTTQATADLSSLDAGGFTLNWSVADATAREFIFLAMGSATAGGVQYTSFLPTLGVG